MYLMRMPMNTAKRPPSFNWRDATAVGLWRCRCGISSSRQSTVLSSVEPRTRGLSQSQQHQHRFFSDIAPQRQGRERFYVQVGVESCAAPWDVDSSRSMTNKKSQESQSIKVVQSPISAGVDGTDSASGVVHPTNSRNSKGKDWMQLLLRPRTPAKSLSNFLNCNDDDKDPMPIPGVLGDCDWHAVTLDGRALRTPMGQSLALPSKALAWAVAVEWNAVRGTIQPVQMPFMTLACTALDQVAAQPDHYRQQCMRFWQTDTVCYWADPVNERLLHQKQLKAWKRLHQWMQKDFCEGQTPGQITEQQTSSNSTVALFPRKTNSNTSNTTTMGLPHPPALTDACTRWIHSLDAWHLAALHSACLESKSLLVAAALVTQYCTARDAQTVCRVEEEFQIDAWGMVEGQHDYDRLNATVQLTAVSVLTDLLSQHASGV